VSLPSYPPGPVYQGQQAGLILGPTCIPGHLAEISQVCVRSKTNDRRIRQSFVRLSNKTRLSDPGEDSERG
jgi:hypothetical protein